MKQLFSILLILFSTANIAFAQKMRIAIVNFNADGVSKATARRVSELIRTEMIKTKKYIVIERSQMDKILKEQGFQQTGCTDVSCAVEIGKMLSARKILVGTVMRMDGSTIITGRIVDVEKGVAEFSEDHNTRRSGIYRGAKIFARKLTNHILGKKSSSHYNSSSQRSNIGSYKRKSHTQRQKKVRGGFGISYDFGYDLNGKVKFSSGGDEYNVENNYLMNIEMHFTLFSMFAIGGGYSYLASKSFEDYSGTFMLMPYYGFLKIYILKYNLSPYAFAQAGKVLIIPDSDFKGTNTVEGDFYYAFGAGIELGYLRFQAYYHKSTFKYGNSDDASYSSIAIAAGYIFHM